MIFSRTCLVGAALSLLLVVIGCAPAGKSQREKPEGKVLVGAGATFPANLYDKWFDEFQRANPDWSVVYDAVGSGEGVKQFVAGTVDFGASDAAMTDREIEQVERGAHLVPTTAGSIVLAYNIPGIGRGLKLSREAYTKIFLGKIDYWDDPVIQKENDTPLPHLQIAVVTRFDSSGTTFAFTNHLSSASPQWREGPGFGKTVNWPPNAMQARGNEGVAAMVSRTFGAIGYVELGFAMKAGLNSAKLQNKEGTFIPATVASGAAALSHIELPSNLRAFVPDPEGSDSYPIVTLTWMLLYDRYDDASKAAALKKLLKYCLTDGQKYNEDLGYLRLPSNIATAALAEIERVKP